MKAETIEAIKEFVDITDLVFVKYRDIELWYAIHKSLLKLSGGGE